MLEGKTAFVTGGSRGIGAAAGRERAWAGGASAVAEGKPASVGGGGRGIGAAIVRKLAAAGAAVTFTYNSSPDAARAAAEAAGDGAQAGPLGAPAAEARAAA